jgi:hypothetical protein
MKGFDDVYEHDVLTSQTEVVKMYTIPMRFVFGHDNITLHSIRRSVLKDKYPAAVILPQEEQVHGVLDGIRLSVAGHLVNSLLAMHFMNVSMSRRMKAVWYNVNAVFGAVRLDSTSMVGEPGSNPYVLWHNYVEYDVAIDAYIVLATRLGLAPDLQAVKYCRIEINKMLKKFPAFRLTQSVVG